MKKRSHELTTDEDVFRGDYEDYEWGGMTPDEMKLFWRKRISIYEAAEEMVFVENEALHKKIIELMQLGDDEYLGLTKEEAFIKFRNDYRRTREIMSLDE